MIPGTNQPGYGGDEIRARDGTVCRQGTHIGPTLDLGVTTTQFGSTQTSDYNAMGGTSPNGSVMGNSSDNGVYARIIVPLSIEPDRVDCTKLYSLELERLELELKKLKESGSANVVIQ